MMQIDLEAAVASKNKKLARYIPSFVFRWLKKLIHQDEMNVFLRDHYHQDSITFAESALREVAQVKIEAENEEKIPREGRYIIVSNHPLGAIDGLGLIALLGRYRSDIKFPVNDLLMQLEPMHQVFLPINKHGKNQVEAIHKMNEVFAGDELVLYFPAGLCSRMQNGVIMDTVWKKSIIQKARQYKRDIIPIYFDAQNSSRFYKLALWRKRLRIPFNLEMILLPDEIYKQKGKILKVIFGDPIPYDTFDNSKTQIEWSEWLKQQTYSLKKKS